MDEILHFFETMATIVCWYLLGTHHFRVSERWCEMDFARPRYVASTSPQIEGSIGILPDSDLQNPRDTERLYTVGHGS